MIISDEQLANWTRPWFSNQEDMASRTESAVKTAINNHSVLKDLSVRVFAKGSYANNTNVRKDSDIDIAVELENLIKLKFSGDATFADTGLDTYTGISEQLFKSYVFEALTSEFHNNVDSSGNKIFRIRGSNKIFNADVIPCTTHRSYSKWGYVQGIQLILNQADGKIHVNFPDQHLEKGTRKNNDTGRRYKRTVRILKNVRNFLADDLSKTKYHSFMIESIAYNIQNTVYAEDTPWREIISNACIDAWKYLKLDEPTTEEQRWTEVNDYKFLFHDDQKWTRDHAKDFILDIYNAVTE